MKELRKILFCSALTLTMLLPAYSFAGVSVMLKNGRSVNADACGDKGDRLVCLRAGGLFELDKSDIDKVLETADMPQEGEDKQPPEKVPAKTAETDNKAAAGGKTDVAPSGGKQGSPEKEIERIIARKKELMQERDALAKDRQKVEEDIKNARDWMSTDQFDELQKKAADIDKRVNSFNNEVNRLDKEEEVVLEQLPDKGAAIKRQ